ncbi:glycerophosphodiester phosphodiesterase family protein [Paraconexibacter sp. AEG42_29]
MPQRRLPALLTALVALGGTAVAVPRPAAGAPVIHAHRGGVLDDGVPVRPEDTLEAFRHTAAAYPDAWLELDAVVSRDGVPFVMHDSTLDRTTDCEGAVGERTAAAIDSCRVDVIGTAQTLAPLPPGAAPVRVPCLAEVLAFAREAGRPVNVEIKRIPGDPGYVPLDEAFATAVMRVVAAADLDPAKLIVQSFDPTNLETARRLLPGVQLSFLTLRAADAIGPAVASALGYQWVSPGGVPDAAYMAQARAAGLKVVPYTLNTTAEVRAAAAAGVDAIITDDVPVARRALGLPVPAVSAAVPSTSGAAGGTVGFPARTRRQVLARGGVAVALRSSGPPARATVQLRRGRVVVAAGTVRVAAAGTRRSLIRLTPAGRRVLRAARRPLKLQARVRVDGRRTVVRAITLR